MPFNRRLIICHKPLTSLKVPTVSFNKLVVGKKSKKNKKNKPKKQLMQKVKRIRRNLLK